MSINYEELIQGIRLHHQDSERAFFKIFNPKCQYLLFTWVTPPEEIKDIVQEALRAVLEAIYHNRQITTSLPSYVRGVLWNIRADALKKAFHNPDINALYGRLATIRREIRDLEGKIGILGPEDFGSADIIELQGRLSLLYSEERRLKSEIVDLMRKIKQASQLEEGINTGNEQPTIEQISQINERDAIVRETIKQVLKKRFPEKWKQELIHNRIYDDFTYPMLSEKYRIGPQKARYIFEKFLDIIGRNLPSGEDLL